MSTTLNRNTAAVEHFRHKLEFEIGPVELKMLLEQGEEVQIVDLRTPELYKEGHVPKAVLADFKNGFEEFITKLEKDVTTVVYCYNITCHLSTKAALLLAKKGYPVKELIGGFNSYAEAELPIEGKKHGSSCGSSSCA